MTWRFLGRQAKYCLAVCANVEMRIPEDPNTCQGTASLPRFCGVFSAFCPSYPFSRVASSVRDSYGLVGGAVSYLQKKLARGLARSQGVEHRFEIIHREDPLDRHPYCAVLDPAQYVLDALFPTGRAVIQMSDM